MDDGANHSALLRQHPLDETIPDGSSMQPPLVPTTVVASPPHNEEDLLRQSDSMDYSDSEHEQDINAQHLLSEGEESGDGADHHDNPLATVAGSTAEAAAVPTPVSSASRDPAGAPANSSSAVSAAVKIPQMVPPANCSKNPLPKKIFRLRPMLFRQPTILK